MKKWTNLFLSIITALTVLVPYTCYAEANNDVVRVCYYPLENTSGKIDEHPYKDYYFDYLQEISQYTGWTYEFVDATYEEALQYFEQTDLRGSYLGLEKISKVLDQLGNPEKQLKLIRIHMMIILINILVKLKRMQISNHVMY